jgi:hypothetical protein
MLKKIMVPIYVPEGNMCGDFDSVCAHLQTDHISENGKSSTFYQCRISDIELSIDSEGNVLKSSHCMRYISNQ